MTYLISFLIPTLKERTSKFKSLTDKIFSQIEASELQDKIEVISIYDNRSIPLSLKRNMMQKMCSGQYFIHMDDDDTIADDYCITVINEINNLRLQQQRYGKTMPDIITYDQQCLVDGSTFIVKTNPNRSFALSPTGNQYDSKMKCNGLIPTYERMFWQYNLFNRKKYAHIYRTDSDTNQREDQNWLKKILLEYPKNFYNIDKILHYYFFDTNGVGENKSTCQ